MKPSDWTRINDLFATASGLGAGQREAFLDRSCADEPELRHQIERLLAADERAMTPLDRPVLDNALEFLSSAISEASIGSRIGPYRVLSEVGTGGMGAVYLAERQDDQIDQRVAIKVIRRGFETELIVERFYRERQILASLDHPNIARFLDGGTTSDGRPYLVMEYIDGEPIDRFCDLRGLPIPERLELFCLVCSAVQFAHQRLAVHRDIKPNNVLVTRDGVPKLLDFGLAKILDPRADDDASNPTATVLPALTPSYASPEQASGLALTTATDVYGLGGLLYKLLVGLPPHRIGSSDASEAARMIRTIEPERPSRAAVAPRPDQASPRGEHSSTPESRARARSSRPARLARLLEGDLDNITLKAIRKEPAERYESAEQLMADVKRYLEGRPVLARRPTFRYRAAKLLSRNRAATAAALVTALLIVFLGALLLWEARRTAHQRDLAELERARAEETLSFMVGLFGDAGAGGESGRRSTARDLIDRGLERARRDFSDRPVERSALLVALGTGYRKLGLYREAQQLHEEAVELRTEHLGADHQDTATSLYELGRTYLDLGEYDAAAPLLTRAAAIREAELEEGHPALSESLAALSDLQVMFGKYDEAEALARRALTSLRRGPESNPLDLANRLHDLGNTLRAQGNLKGALRLLREALEIRQQLLAEDHPDLGVSSYDMAVILVRLGNPERAEELYERSLRIFESSLGAEHRYTAAAAQGLGSLYGDQGRYAAAETLLRRALAAMQAAVGEEHPDMATLTQNLGLLLFRQGNLAGADEEFRRAQELYEATVGADHPFPSYSLHYRGAIARRMGHFDIAERLLGRALEIRRESLPETHHAVPRTLHELGLLARDRGRLDEAREKLRRALTLREKASGAEHPDTAETLFELARLDRRRGGDREALALAERALEIRRVALGRSHEDTLAAAELVDRLQARVVASRSGEHPRDSG